MSRQAQPEPPGLGHQLHPSGDGGLQGHQTIDGLLCAAEGNDRDRKQRHESWRAEGATGIRRYGVVRPISVRSHPWTSRIAGAHRPDPFGRSFSSRQGGIGP